MGGKPKKGITVKVNGKTVAPEDLSKLCHECGNLKGVRREVYTKNYMGPCGDSFCYASCDMSACRPQKMQICDGCLPGVSKKW